MTLSVLGAIKGKVIIKGKVKSKMVGEKSRSVYRKKRKRNFSGRRKQKEESEETAPDVGEIAALTPSTSRDENQLSDSDSKETVGSSRKKMKYADEELLLDSSDEEYTFNTEESEGYRLINVKNLSTAVSKAHVCEKGEKFFKSMSFSVFDYDLFPISYRPLVPVFPC